MVYRARRKKDGFIFYQKVLVLKSTGYILYAHTVVLLYSTCVHPATLKKHTRHYVSEYEEIMSFNGTLQGLKPVRGDGVSTV